MTKGGQQRTVAPVGADDPAEWAAWFHGALMPWWLVQARDSVRGGFFDGLTEDGEPITDRPKTTLVQARLLFTLSHLYRQRGESQLLKGARHAYRFLMGPLSTGDGGYVCAVARNGQPTGRPSDAARRSYDQSFVLLGLVTYYGVEPSPELSGALKDCWSFIETHLIDPATGALFEDDTPDATAQPPKGLRAQNPHMHMFEALLQAYDVTGDPVWMERAERILDVVRRHFIDECNGSVIEFRSGDLSPAPGRDGMLREIGHQCEWAWLLHRYVRLGGDPQQLALAGRMMAFAERCGFQTIGPMRGAAYDEVDREGAILSDSMLLWPQTEAGKAYVARFEQNGDPADAERARALMRLVFTRYFAGSAAWRNQVDNLGHTLQPLALSRLLYHVSVFVTEGERVGLWPSRP